MHQVSWRVSFRSRIPKLPHTFEHVYIDKSASGVTTNANGISIRHVQKLHASKRSQVSISEFIGRAFWAPQLCYPRYTRHIKEGPKLDFRQTLRYRALHRLHTIYFGRPQENIYSSFLSLIFFECGYEVRLITLNLSCKLS